MPTSKNLLSEIGHVHFMWLNRTPSDSLVAPMRPYSKEIQNCRSDMHFNFKGVLNSINYWKDNNPNMVMNFWFDPSYVDIKSSYFQQELTQLQLCGIELCDILSLIHI